MEDLLGKQILSDFSELVGRTTSSDEAWKLLERYLLKYGFGKLFYAITAYPCLGELNTTDIASITSYNDSFIDFYIGEGYVEDDETIAAVLNSPKVYKWESIDTIKKKFDAKVYTPRTFELGEFVWDSGFRHGFTIPLERNSPIKFAGIGLVGDSLTWSEYFRYPDALLNQISQIALIFHNHITSLTSFGGLVSLSEEDQHVLNGIAQGWSHEEIARVCGISIKRVRNRQSAMMNRLSVRTRTQLIARGHSYNLINIDMSFSSEYLTERELESLRWSSMGLKPHEIADKLKRSEAAIRKRHLSIIEKLDVENIEHATAKALYLGLLS